MNVRAVATSLITSCQHEGLECFGGFAASRFGAAVHQGGVQEWSCHVTDDGRQRGTTSPSFTNTHQSDADGARLPGLTTENEANTIAQSSADMTRRRRPRGFSASTAKRRLS